MVNTLVAKTCTPCRGGIPPLTPQQAERFHVHVSFGWGYVTVTMQTKKIKGLHENDFIIAAKIDQLFERA